MGVWWEGVPESWSNDKGGCVTLKLKVGEIRCRCAWKEGSEVSSHPSLRFIVLAASVVREKSDVVCGGPCVVIYLLSIPGNFGTRFS